MQPLFGTENNSPGQPGCALRRVQVRTRHKRCALTGYPIYSVSTLGSLTLGGFNSTADSVGGISERILPMAQIRAITARDEEVFEASKHHYGSPRVTREIKSPTV